ncbi:hypothetical protein [Halalkalibacter urbisdiaboli]|nr:hypothetical protein [Halalkalibacter urbisdiaboli]
MDKEQNKKMSNKQQSVQSAVDNAEAKQAKSVQEDGFRYDYDDSSDLKK